MDTTFTTLLRMMEKSRKDGDLGGQIFLMEKLLRYGIAHGLLLENGPKDAAQETEESVLLRAGASAALLRDFRDEEVGSVLDMTTEERQELIKHTDELAKEVGPVLKALVEDSPLPAPHKIIFS